MNLKFYHYRTQAKIKQLQTIKNSSNKNVQQKALPKNILCDGRKPAQKTKKNILMGNNC